MAKKYILVKGNTYGKYYTRNTFDHYYSLWSIDGRGYIQCEVDNISSYDEIKDEYDVSNKDHFIKVPVIIIQSWEMDSCGALSRGDDFYKVFKTKENFEKYIKEIGAKEKLEEVLGWGYEIPGLFLLPEECMMSLYDLEEL